LPLPDPALVAQKTGPYYNLVPFQNVIDFIKHSSFVLTEPSTWLTALKESYVLEPAFNFLLTVPFGIYLAYYFKSSFKKVLLFSFLLSLFFEITQLTGLYGYYVRPYRLFDINDLILNTLGGATGFVIFKNLLQFLPTRDHIDATSIARGHRVGYLRRLLAVIVDSIVIGLITLLIAAFTPYEEAYLVVTLLYFPLLTILWRGGTFGKWLVGIKVGATSLAADGIAGVVSSAADGTTGVVSSAADGTTGVVSSATTASPLRLVMRYTMRTAVIFLFQAMTWLASDSDITFNIFLTIAEVVLLLLLVIDFIASFSKRKQLWYERWTHTSNISTHARKKART
jgi:glycopeptide antibiotics resistance protein